MDDHLSDILNDIYVIEPDLKERDGELRHFVAALINANPLPQARAEFISALRSRLLPVSRRGQIERHSVNWWFVHVAPIGAIALLLLMLVPELERPVDRGAFAPSIEEERAPRAPSLPIGSFGGGPTVDTSMEMKATEGFPRDRFVISNQLPGIEVIVDEVTLSRPGFVVITEYRNGEVGLVIGSSELLSIGTTAGVPVPLARVIAEKETYAARLYIDDGDGLFVPEIDMPVLDPALMVPVIAPFDVTTEQDIDSLTE